MGLAFKATEGMTGPRGRGEDPVLWLQLIRSRRVGAVTFHRLLADHGGVEAALKALPQVARAAGVADYAVCPLPVVRAELTAGRAARAELVLFGQGDYPASLMDLTDAPPVLWARGQTALLARPMVAMAGARNASSLGLRMARLMARQLGEAGQVVVSGMARGIDAEAHRAALDTGTVAVLAGGVDVIYPEENRALTAEVAEKGCLVSEQPPGLQPQARHFPLRNRLISGLSRGVVIVEAAVKSGSLITAREALDQGREVMAVPGHPFDARAAGCNELIRDGAILVRGAQDVLQALGAVPAHAPMVNVDGEADTAGTATLPDPAPLLRAWRDQAALHREILEKLGPSPLAEDQLIRDLAAPPADFARALVTLELDGQVLRQPGGLLSRVV